MTLESLIQAKSADFMEHHGYLFDGPDQVYEGVMAFLTSSLKEAYLAGLTAAEDSLMKHSSYEDRKDNSSYETGAVDGHRCALSSLKSLKEEATNKTI